MNQISYLQQQRQSQQSCNDPAVTKKLEAQTTANKERIAELEQQLQSLDTKWQQAVYGLQSIKQAKHEEHEHFVELQARLDALLAIQSSSSSPTSSSNNIHPELHNSVKPMKQTHRPSISVEDTERKHAVKLKKIDVNIQGNIQTQEALLEQKNVLDAVNNAVLPTEDALENSVSVSREKPKNEADALARRIQLVQCADVYEYGATFIASDLSGTSIRCLNLTDIWTKYAYYPEYFGFYWSGANDDDVHTRMVPMSVNLLQALLIFGAESKNDLVQTSVDKVLAYWRSPRSLDNNLAHIQKEATDFLASYADVDTKTHRAIVEQNSIVMPAEADMTLQSYNYILPRLTTQEAWERIQPIMTGISAELSKLKFNTGIDAHLYMWMNAFGKWDNAGHRKIRALMRLIKVDRRILFMKRRKRTLTTPDNDTFVVICEEHVNRALTFDQKFDPSLGAGRYDFGMQIKEGLILYFRCDELGGGSESPEFRRWIRVLCAKLNIVLPLFVKYGAFNTTISNAGNMLPRFQVRQIGSQHVVLWSSTHTIDLKDQSVILLQLYLALQGDMDFAMFEKIAETNCLYVPLVHTSKGIQGVVGADGGDDKQYVFSDNINAQDVDLTQLLEKWPVDDRLVEQEAVFAQVTRIFQDMVTSLQKVNPDVSHGAMYEVCLQLFLQGESRWVHLLHHAVTDASADALFLGATDDIDEGIMQFIESITQVKLPENWWREFKVTALWTILDVGDGVHEMEEALVRGFKRRFDTDNHMALDILQKQVNATYWNSDGEDREQRYSRVSKQSNDNLAPDKVTLELPVETVAKLLFSLFSKQRETKDGQHVIVPLRYRMRWEGKDIGHINAVIVDLKTKRIEAYESNDIYSITGHSSEQNKKESQQRAEATYSLLFQLAENLNTMDKTSSVERWNVMLPHEVMPFGGTQRSSVDSLCNCWIYLIMQVRMMFPNMEPSELLGKVLNPTHLRADQMYELILKYAFYLKKLATEQLEFERTLKQ